MFQNRVVVVGIMLVISVVTPQILQTIEPDPAFGMVGSLTILPSLFGLPTLILGVALGYRSVVGERVSKTIRIILGLPVTRHKLILAKVLSRVVGALFVLAPIFLFVEGLVILRFNRTFPLLFLTWSGLIAAFAIFWVTIAVGISAAVSSPYRSIAGCFGVFFLFSNNLGVWGWGVRPLIVTLFAGTVSGSTIRQVQDEVPLVRYLDHLNPFRAFQTVQESLFSLVGVGAEASSPSVPIVLFSLLVLLAIPSVSLHLGYKSFDNSEL
nr:ABC transporter permease subunit [Haloferax larsenii]